MCRLALGLHGCLRERQVGSVSGAALALTLAALAVVHPDRFGSNFISDRAAGASTRIGFAHVSSPSINHRWTHVVRATGRAYYARAFISLGCSGAAYDQLQPRR